MCICIAFSFSLVTKFIEIFYEYIPFSFLSHVLCLSFFLYKKQTKREYVCVGVKGEGG